MKAHGPGGAVVALAHVDHDLAAVRAQRRIARVVILVGRPAEKQRTVGMATHGGLRGPAPDPAPGLSVPYVEPVHRPRIRRREIVGDHVDAACLQERAPVPHPRAAFEERRVLGQDVERLVRGNRPGEQCRQLATPAAQVEDLGDRRWQRCGGEDREEVEIRVVDGAERSPPTRCVETRLVEVETAERFAPLVFCRGERQAEVRAHGRGKPGLERLVRFELAELRECEG